jgi:hypothetical protein
MTCGVLGVLCILVRLHRLLVDVLQVRSVVRVSRKCHRIVARVLLTC